MYSILAGFVIILIIPVLANGTLLYLGTPDIQYIMGKVLWVMQGELYTDPVTGIVTFHPPIYHLLLSIPARLGIDIESILYFMSMLNVAAICLTIFLAANRITNRKMAFITALMTPFIVNFMGFGYIFLASAFNFSVPIFLLGLWHYFKPKAEPRNLIYASVLWGIAFIISPVYLFLIGFTLLYELIIRRDFKRFAYLTVPLLITLIPFYIQAYVVYRSGMTDATTFALWRGVPDWEWLRLLILFTLSPVMNEFSLWVLPVAALLLFGIYILSRARPLPAFPIIAAAAYIFTAYCFSHQYATRMYFFLSIFLIAYIVNYLLARIRVKAVAWAIIAVIFGSGVYSHFEITHKLYTLQDQRLPPYRIMRASLTSGLKNLIKPGDTILATEETYRFFILPVFPVHGLIAYKSGEYFQLGKKAADKILNDYNRLIGAGDISLVNSICDAYDINTCVIRFTSEMDMPGYKAIAQNWTPVFEDRYCRIYQRQPAANTPTT